MCANLNDLLLKERSKDLKAKESIIYKDSYELLELVIVKLMVISLTRGFIGAKVKTYFACEAPR